MLHDLQLIDSRPSRPVNRLNDLAVAVAIRILSANNIISFYTFFFIKIQFVL